MLDELKKHKTLGTWRKNKVDADKLKAYAPTLSFADVTPVFLTKYHKHLQNEGLSNNTIWAAFKHIRQVLNHAKSLGVTSYYPFKEWKVPKYKEQPRNYLVKEDLDRLRDLLDKPLNDTFKLVTAFFLLECYSGIRHSDWAKFNIEKLLDGENMILRATKTGVRVTIPLDVYPSLNWVVSYIRDNGLVYDLSGQKTNIYLKSIAAMAGIDKTVTTHIGRHTFAVLMLEKGFTKELIAELMGVSMRVVNTYAKYTTNKARVEFERLGGL
jgi:site-specific recombinase XerD